MNEDVFFDVDRLNILNKYSIEFGIFQEDGQKVVEVDVLNTDETTTKVEMTIGEIMYFTEYGTIMIPGKYILEKSLNYINTYIDVVLDDITTKILVDNISDNEIENIFKEFILKFENYVKSLFISYIKSNNIINNILGNNQQQKYVYDLRKLSKYIKCKLVKSE